MMKARLPIFLCFFLSCTNLQKEYRQADNALDAGREYIQACMEGDFGKAAFYLNPDEKNKQLLGEVEKAYREKDKEGRQQFRLASININQVMEITPAITLIKYSNSFDKIPHTILVIKQKEVWKVDLTNTFNPTN